MTGTRTLEISLAALIAGTAMFTALVPGASSSVRHAYAPPPMNAPDVRIDSSDFADLDMSRPSRAVAAQVMSGELRTTRLNTTPAVSEPFTPPPGLRVSPRASAPSEAAWRGRAVGLAVTAAPLDGGETRWWLAGGAGRESYVVAPAGLGEFTIAPVAAETTIGDAHLGVAVALNDNAYASIGYVREKREFSLGAQDWEEDEHYLGIGLRARW